MEAADVVYDPVTGQSVQSAIDEIKQGLDTKKDKNYVHIQNEPSVVWTISHNLHKKPAVFCEDFEQNDIEPDVHYVDEDNVMLTFSVPVSGRAVLN